MVNLWPFRGDDNSAAAFEKTLSTLSAKITKAQSQLDSLRQRSRRYKALWTLYTSLAYMLCAIVLAVVVGLKNCDAYEYTALAGSPVIIYLVRTAIVSYYNYRINIITARLNESQNERTKTINKLKEATKYNSTQQLLEKYGEMPRTEPPSRTTTSDVANRKATLPARRTGLNPPATANISRQNTPSQPISPHSPQRRSEISQIYPQTTSAMQDSPSLEPGFAPNAFEERQYDSHTRHESRWYDRIFDLLLGDDETSAKNRMVLICKHCRLVNGQAPPGIKRVEDVGKWRCIACHKMNGEEDEGRRIVAEMKERLAVSDTVEAFEPTQKRNIARDSEDSEVSEEEINIKGQTARTPDK